MASNSAAISAYYAGDYLTMYGDNENLSFYYPKEGTNIYIDAMCVPASSENQLIAERYINFMLSEEIAVANAEYTCYASPNTVVTQNAEYQEYMASIHPDAMNILYNEEHPVKTIFYENLSREKLTMLNSLWEELKIDSSIGNSFYIICGVLVAFISAFALYYIIRQKKRAKYYENL
jgi:spermidine/putrescine transport system substrate-binding protein